MHIRTIWSLVKTADWVSLLVISLLVASYFLCFFIIVYKCIALFHESSRMQKLKKIVGNSWRLQDFIAAQKVQGFGSSVGEKVVLGGLHEVQHLVTHNKKTGGYEYLSVHDIDRLQQAIDQSIDDGVARAQFGLPILSTSAAVAPLAGLFGTIWGLMHAFVNIGLERSADLAVIAPGIAEALLTTLMGLVVAIPALVFYHYLAQKIAKLERQMVVIGDRLLASATYAFRERVSDDSQPIDLPDLSQSTHQSL